MVNIPCKIVCILGLSWCGTMLNTREIQIQSTAESFQIWICSKYGNKYIMPKVWRSLFRKEEIYISSVFFFKICMFASHRVNWMWLAIPEDFRMRMNIKQKHDVFVNAGCRRKKMLIQRMPWQWMISLHYNTYYITLLSASDFWFCFPMNIECMFVVRGRWKEWRARSGCDAIYRHSLSMICHVAMLSAFVYFIFHCLRRSRMYINTSIARSHQMIYYY